MGIGSPAHAGIDRHKVKGVTRQGWFPRTRGDRPAWSRTVSRNWLVPPHTRG